MEFLFLKDFSTALSIEELEKRFIMDERDLDYLEHLEVPEINVNEVAIEGIVTAVLHGTGSVVTDTYRELKGWFLGMESKRQYIERICQDVIIWLKDNDLEQPGLSLDMGTFKTWMKTSETFRWRYYFFLDDNTWRQIENDLKTGNITDIEKVLYFDLKPKRDAARRLDSITTIKDLIKVVELYIQRSNIFFDLITKRKIRIKSAPFQIILLGATDLRRAVKKIVNLAK